MNIVLSGFIAYVGKWRFLRSDKWRTSTIFFPLIFDFKHFNRQKVFMSYLCQKITKFGGILSVLNKLLKKGLLLWNAEALSAFMANWPLFVHLISCYKRCNQLTIFSLRNKNIICSYQITMKSLINGILGRLSC